MKLSNIIYELIQIAFRSGYRKGSQKLGFTYEVGPVTQKRKAPMPLSLKINNEQQVVVHLNPADAKRKPVKLFSVPTWTADDGGSATVTPAADGLSATVVATADGTTVITISAEGDPSPGEDTLTDTVTVLVVDPDAISLGLTADPPTLQP